MVVLRLTILVLYCTILAESADLENHPAWKYINNDEEGCGESNSDRIIGGTNAALGQYPWIALLGYRYEDFTLFQCGGSLINPVYVVTAAHCTKSQEKILKMVRLGEYDQGKDPDCAQNVCANPVQDIDIVKIIVHENYNKPRFANDISLLRLAHKADYNGWVSPICMPRRQVDHLYKGIAEVAGWGITNMKTRELSTILQTLKIPLQPLSKCQKAYKMLVIDDKQVCAGGHIGEDSCGGDSGGPLMKVDVEDGTPKYYLLGLVSFGLAKCGEKVPAIYVRIDRYLNWILDNIEPTY